MFYLLIIIIGLLVYNIFFTPEKIELRQIRKIQSIFNKPLYPNAEEFYLDDIKNQTNPNEIVKFGFKYMTRQQALDKFEETKKMCSNISNEEIEKIARSRF